MRTAAQAQKILLVGDIHGNLNQVKSLWTTAETAINEPFRAIFLGDYVDRGEDSKGVLDFLTSIKKSTLTRPKHSDDDESCRSSRCTEVTFMAGNHDLAMGLFLSLYDVESWKVDRKANDEFVPQRAEGLLWSGKGDHDIHLQGRRWGGSVQDPHTNPYQSLPTFESYGVQHGDRDGLMQAMGVDHLEFLRSLEFLHKVPLGPGFGKYKNLLAVHSGIEMPGTKSYLRSVPSVQEQIEELKDCSVLSLPWIESLQGRRNTMKPPQELVDEGTLIVSGHHGFMDLSHDYRWVIDNGSKNSPIAAVLLPDEHIIYANGTVSKRGDSFGQSRAG